uniref:Uncharacterized protein n=1 Tax=Anguilla anguilla TaxID=7936 RepID=A0A0E9SWY1_ANGAN
MWYEVSASRSSGFVRS